MWSYACVVAMGCNQPVAQIADFWGQTTDIMEICKYANYINKLQSGIDEPTKTNVIMLC